MFAYLTPGPFDMLIMLILVGGIVAAVLIFAAKKTPATSVGRAFIHYCRNCGKSVDAQAIACMSCGRAPSNGNRFCHNCGATTDPAAIVCVKCGVSTSVGGEGSKSKITAGLLAIFLGGLGIHKFHLGFTTPGLVFLLTNTVGLILTAWLFCIPNFVLAVIALVEGIIYLTKSDEEFEQLYVVQKKQWF
jgi:TM2 domain-containing membrane protein YozV